jgi:hypothetical protein
LAVGGVDLHADWAVPQDDFLDRVHREIRSKSFSAVVIAGAESSELWLQPLRRFAPHQTILCYLPDVAPLTTPVRRPANPGDPESRTRWKRLLSLADGVWVEREDQALALHRTGLLLEGKLAAAATRRWSPRELSVGLTALSRSRQVSARSIQISALGFSRGEAALLRDSAGRVAGRRPALDSSPLGSSSGGIPELNRALKGLRSEFLWLCAHPFNPSENLFRTLWDGMQVLPFAGGAVPADCARKPDAESRSSDDIFAAAWALAHKGDWHEVDHLSHFCCVLLRRRAVQAAGLLDERFLDPQYALIDYCLRLQQAGYPVYQARDALVFHRGRRSERVVDEQRDLLVDKWSKGSLKFMESLLTALEPEGYRGDPVVSAGFQGQK